MSSAPSRVRRRGWTYDKCGKRSSKAINCGDTNGGGHEEAVGEEPEENANGGFGVGGAGLAIQMGAEDEHLKGGVECADAFDGLGDTVEEASGSASFGEGQNEKEESETHGLNHPSASKSSY